MRIDEKLLSHVSGTRFSEMYKADIEQRSGTRHRFDLLETLVRGKRVIHVGCIDHVPLLAEKIGAGTWFHGRLTRAASQCVGVDINTEGVTKARVEFGIDNVFYGDVAGDRNIAPIVDGSWDYMVLGEVLEHVDNPVEFLQAIVANYGARVAHIVITVPNAFRGGNVLAIFKNQEWINSDHRYWFTPFTLMKVASRAGLVVETLELCHFSGNAGFKGRLKNAVLRRFPLLCEDLVAICHPTVPALPTISAQTVVAFESAAAT